MTDSVTIPACSLEFDLEHLDITPDLSEMMTFDLTCHSTYAQASSESLTFRLDESRYGVFVLQGRPGGSIGCKGQQDVLTIFIY